MDRADEELTAQVVASFDRTEDPRLRQVLTRLVTHLHAFVREVEPTHAEWAAAVEFLTAVGQWSDDRRQEMVLLSDVLGVSSLVDGIGDRKGGGATESTVLGPFHQADPPRRELGAMIAPEGEGEGCVVTGRVTSADGAPLPWAEVDVWQADHAGFYDVQLPDPPSDRNLRGLFTADGDGAFWFRTVVPSHYSIPSDGPVGRLLRLTGRHPFRPAHIHFIVSAEGHRPVTTHLFVGESPYLDSDAVFAVRRSLIRDFAEVDDAGRAERYGVPNPFRHAHFEVVLQPEVGAGDGG